MDKLLCLLTQPKGVPLKLVTSTVPACRILAKYFRIKDGLEIFSVVKKLYFSSYKANIQAQVSTPLENSSLCLILWERHENVV